jgi:hypothetical protein
MFFQGVENGRERKTVRRRSSEAKWYLLACHLPQFKQSNGFRQAREKDAAEGPETGRKGRSGRPDRLNSGMKKMARDLQNLSSELIL